MDDGTKESAPVLTTGDTTGGPSGNQTAPGATSADSPPPPLVRARRVAWLMDDSIPLPGTRFRFGLDPLLGLGPGVGDVISWVVSLHLLWAGWKLRAGPSTLIRMAGHVLLDTVLGALPAVGDLFDFVYKANDKNLQILEVLFTDPESIRRSSVGWLTLILATSLAAMGVTAWVMISVLKFLGALLGF